MERIELLPRFPNRTFTARALMRILEISIATVYLWKDQNQPPLPQRKIPTPGGKHKLYFVGHEVLTWVESERPEKAALMRAALIGGDRGHIVA